MTRNRAITVLALVGLAGVGLTVLMAAGQPTGKSSEPAKTPASTSKGLVCLGYADTEDPMIRIYPDNFPQPSQVTKVLAHEGEEVREGQKLLELDTSLLELNVRAAEIGIAAAQGDLAKAQAMLRGHGVQVNALEKEWKAKQAALDAKEKELESARKAVQGTTFSPDFNEKQAAVDEAKLNLEAARIKWDGLKGEVPTYLVDQSQQGIERARNLKAQADRAVALTTCTAKADGKIIRSFVSEGSQFGPMSRDPAFWFVKKGGPLLIRAEVTQEFAARVVKGQTATVHDESDDKQTWKGRVTKVGDQFLHKRQSNGSALDIFPVNDDRVLECIVTLDPVTGQAPPRFGQRVRITLGE
jgi:multidrug efflux pump subunit AcrA (membrane-fusion protein)